MSDLPIPSPSDDNEAVARAAGYGWDEIDSHIDRAQSEAFDAGFEPHHVDQYLGYDPGAVDGAAENVFAGGDGSLNLNSLNLRGAYADLLSDNAVRGPESLVYSLAGHAMEQTGADGGSIPNVSDQVQGMVNSLPSRRNLIDGALSISGDSDYEIVRQNMIDAWHKTGLLPTDMAEDPSMRDQLTTPPRGIVGEFYNAAIRGVGDVFFSLAGLGGQIESILFPEEAKPKLAELDRVVKNFNRDWAPTRNDWAGWAVNLIGEGGAQLAGLAAGGVEAAVTYGAMTGASHAWADTHSLWAAATGAAIGAAEMGLPIAGLHGAAGQGLVAGAVGTAIRGAAYGTGAAFLDPIPDMVGGQPYRLTMADIENKTAGGALLGGLAGALSGTFAKARTPMTRLVNPDGSTEIIPHSQIPTIDEGEHRAAVEEVVRPSGEVQLGKPEILTTDAGGQTEHWPITSDGGRVATAQISRIGGIANIDSIDIGDKLSGQSLVNSKGANTLGPRAMRSLARQFFEQNSDIDTITGFRMTGARGIENAKEIAITREQVMKGVKPAEGEPEPPTGLEASYQAAGGFRNMWEQFAPGFIQRILADQTGKLNLPTGKDNWSTIDELQRDVGGQKGALQKGLSDTFRPLYKVVEPYYKVYKAAMDAGDVQGELNSELGLALRYIDGENIAFHPSHPLMPFIQAVQQTHLLNRAWLERGTQRGDFDIKHFINDYWSRIWKDPEAPDRRPSGSFLHQRGEMTYKEARESGLEPVFPHPIDHVMFDSQNRIAYVMEHELDSYLTEKGLMEWHAEHPGGNLVEVAGRTKRATTYELEETAPDKFERVRRDTTLKPYAEPELVKQLSNIRGQFYGQGYDKEFVTNFRKFTNTLQAYNLFGGLYHAVTEAQATIATGMGLVARDIFKGDFGNIGTDLSNLIRGDKLRTQLAELGRLMPDQVEQARTLMPGLDMAVRGGFWPGSRQDVYRPGSAVGLVEALQRGTYGREIKEMLDQPWYTLPGIAAHELARVATSASSLLFDKAIPHLKAGAVMSQIEQWIRQNPGASDEARIKAARQIVDNTDDRMGELNYNNLYWGRQMRAATSTSMISTGWIYGTIRQVAAAAGVRLRTGGKIGSGQGVAWELNPYAMTNLATMLMTAAGAGILYQYIKTGQWPGEGPVTRGATVPPWLHDVIAPQTGGKTKGGQPARIILPGEQKEFYDWGKIVARANHAYNAPHGGPWVAGQEAILGTSEYAAAKLQGWLRILNTIRTGVDPVGRMPAYTPEGRNRWLENVLLPIMISNWEQVRPKSKIGLEALVGVRELPDWISDPMRANAVEQYMVRKNWSDALRQYRNETMWLKP